MIGFHLQFNISNFQFTTERKRRGHFICTEKGGRARQKEEGRVRRRRKQCACSGRGAFLLPRSAACCRGTGAIAPPEAPVVEKARWGTGTPIRRGKPENQKSGGPCKRNRVACVFCLGSEDYVVMVEQVREVLKLWYITAVLNASAYVVGVTAPGQGAPGGRPRQAARPCPQRAG